MAAVLTMPRPNRLPKEIKKTAPCTTDQKPASIPAMLRHNPTLSLLLAAGILSFAGQLITTVFLINIIKAAGGGTADMGLALFVQTMMELPPMFLSKWLLNKFGSRKLLLVSFFAFFIKVLALSLMPTTGLIIAAMTLSIFCFGLFGFSSVYFINGIVKDTEKVRGQSLLGLCCSGGIATVLGSFLGGVLIDSLGLNFFLIVSTFLTFLGFVFMLLVNRSYKKNFARQHTEPQLPDEKPGLSQTV